MSHRFFLIDADSAFRSLISHHLSARWSDAKITEYDPSKSGRLPDTFGGAGNDLILLSHPINEESAMDWLQQFAKVANFPPVIVLGGGNVRDIVAAIKFGAADYIIRDQITHKILIDIVAATLATDSHVANATKSASEAEFELPGFKDYRMQRRISGGDIASVYLTEEIATGRSVILKVLQQVPDSGDGNIAFDRFLQEFDLIGSIDHPNVVKIFDLGVADDQAFIAMEYCSRGSLKRRIQKGLSSDQAIEYMLQVAGALGAIHDVGIAHRDLKPTNVMFREDNSLALIDFGLAKDAHLEAEITGSGEIFGTPYYMSPEQGHGKPADRRADIYSLGIIFYEMLTGEKPFVGDSAMAVIMKHKRDPIPTLPHVVERFQPLINRMLAKSPEERYQTIADLLADQPQLINS